jgi:hypothetical protein
LATAIYVLLYDEGLRVKDYGSIQYEEWSGLRSTIPRMTPVDNLQPDELRIFGSLLRIEDLLDEGGREFAWSTTSHFRL